MAEAARLAYFAYFRYGSNDPIFSKIFKEVITKVLPTKTSLYMVCVEEKAYPSYRTIAVRGTIGVDDCRYDGIQHAFSQEGISDYQKDAYETLLAYVISNPKGSIVLTGHSMGGKIVDMLLAQAYVAYQGDDVKARQVAFQVMERVVAIYSFDSPGGYSLVSSYFNRVFSRSASKHLKNYLSIRKRKVFDVVGHPNSVNMCHRHIGAVLFLPSYGSFDASSLAHLLKQDYTSDLVEKHNILSMAEAIAEGRPLIPVSCWGGRPGDAESSRGRMRDFAASYLEYAASQQTEKDSLLGRARLSALGYACKLLPDRIDPSIDVPLMTAAMKADESITQLKNGSGYMLLLEKLWRTMLSKVAPKD